MPAATIVAGGPSLQTFIKSLKQSDIETSIALFISLLKGRQIRNPRPCAIATAELLLRVVAAERVRDSEGAQKLIERIKDVGSRLSAAQPKEMVVGNIVRRVLGVVREIAEDEVDDGDDGSSDASEVRTPPIRSAPGDSRRPTSSSSFTSLSPLGHGAAISQTMPFRPAASRNNTDGNAELAMRRPLLSSSVSYAGQNPQSSSLLSFLEHPLGRTPSGTPSPSTQSPNIRPMLKNQDTKAGVKSKLDIKAEVINGIQDLLDELDVVDTQIAESALDHIHNNEIILTHTSSQTVQKFLATAARKRKFTVVHVEAFPNDHEATHNTIVNGGRSQSGGGGDASDERWKPLTSMGITVILIPDSAVFALMSRINKVILAPHTVLANGSLLAAAGANTIATAAREHHVPVVVLSGVYKLSPIYPFDVEELIEYGDPRKVVPLEDREFTQLVDVKNPLYDWVDAELVDLYITNLGGCAPSFLYRIVADHYRVEDADLGAKAN